jgi:hypothetical protein
MGVPWCTRSNIAGNWMVRRHAGLAVGRQCRVRAETVPHSTGIAYSARQALESGTHPLVPSADLPKGLSPVPWVHRSQSDCTRCHR